MISTFLLYILFFLTASLEPGELPIVSEFLFVHGLQRAKSSELMSITLTSLRLNTGILSEMDGTIS